MSHFSEYKSNASSPDDRNLGDEWADWDGAGGETLHSGKGLFLGYAGAVVVLMNVVIMLAVYLMSPRLSQWYVSLPFIVWTLAFVFALLTLFWFVQLVFTAMLERNFFLMKNGAYRVFDLVFSKVFMLGQLAHISRDKMANSFVNVSNAVARGLKVRGRQERVLLLLPRCLRSEQIKELNSYKDKYGIFVHTVSGGELARKRVKELKPTAVVGIACERDLVSGIRDVGIKLSVIGIPNERPEGPCKNTYIDLAKVREAIKFYLGKKSSR